jgi:hypothetical protein
MRSTTIITRCTLVLTLSIAAACKSEPPAVTKSAPAASTVKTEESAGAHAAANVEPGSHEDWCAEHGVPESQCTRCNPSLVAAFKATGDWCQEHGVPESQCHLCNPDLKIERPPKKEAAQ